MSYNFRMMYNKTVQTFFFEPKHVGILDLTKPYTVHSRIENKAQNALFDLYLHCLDDGTIKKLLFKAAGSPYLIAALECLCQRLEGGNIYALLPFHYHMLVCELEMPQSQYPIAVQVESAYKEIVQLMQHKLAR